MADSNIQTLDTVKPITLDEYKERTAHLQENTTSLLSTIADRQVQAAGLATQAASLASEVNAVAEQASLSFSKKTWTDTATSGTPITAAELNRLENAISSLTTAVNNLQDSVSRINVYTGSKVINTRESWAILFTRQEFMSTFGRTFSNAYDSISVMNGDGKANNITVFGVTYYPSDQSLVVALSAKGNGSFRINYTVVLAKI